MEIAPVRTQLVQFEEVEPESRIAFPVRFDPGFRVEDTNLLSRVVQVWGEVPVALLQNLDIQRGLYGFIGLNDYTMYPLLRPGSFVFIDDRFTDVVQSGWKTELERPIYFIEFRNGYACSWCERKGDDLVLVPHPLSSRALQIYPANEAEIIGQVVALATRLAGPGPDEVPSRIPPQLTGKIER
jgi:hypothetical protein